MAGRENMLEEEGRETIKIRDVKRQERRKGKAERKGMDGEVKKRETGREERGEERGEAGREARCGCVLLPPPSAPARGPDYRLGAALITRRRDNAQLMG